PRPMSTQCQPAGETDRSAMAYKLTGFGSVATRRNRTQPLPLTLGAGGRRFRSGRPTKNPPETGGFSFSKFLQDVADALLWKVFGKLAALRASGCCVGPSGSGASAIIWLHATSDERGARWCHDDPATG